MLFQSQGFVLLFLPAAVAAYYGAAGSARGRQWVLIAASLFFYGWWDVRFVPLLVGQIVATWGLARAQQGTGRDVFLVAGIILNLASLATFKYLDFLIGSVEAVAGVALPRAHLVLPIGISFFSFQLVSYLVDRLRCDAPVYPLRPFALFVLLFPHLIAGPIVRHNELIAQFAADPRRDGLWARSCLGMVLFTLGLAKKVLLADRLGDIVDPLFAKVADQLANGA
ncbi:MAG: MBOAT family protein, partial [Bradyrhizobiaceae bacterium]|nr:MBOAT family protein [Bradyrhizobiaceae bacterium]